MRKIRVQADRAAHDAPWRTAIEQGFFAEEGLEVAYHEGNTRCEEFGERFKESSLVAGALDVYPVCEWGAIKRVRDLGHARILATDATIRRGAILVRADSPVRRPEDLADLPVAVTWHAGSHYVTLETLERYLPRERIRVVHADDRLAALFDGRAEAATVMEPLVGEGEGRGARRVLEVEWRGGIVVGDDVDPETAERILRALRKAVRWLRADRERVRAALLRDVPEAARASAVLPEPVEPDVYPEDRFRETYRWMVERGLIAPGAEYGELVRG